MHREITLLTSRLDSLKASQLKLIPWASPIPCFGNLDTARIATVGLNPSNLEFVDAKGSELDGLKRRFPTLKSLGISTWGQIEAKHVEQINSSCLEYFFRNPYNEWFKQLDRILAGTSKSYYFPNGQICHLDLIPYATACKWSELDQDQRSLLLDETKDILGLLLEKSKISLLVLNGQTVMSNFEKISDTTLDRNIMNDWTLPRKDKIGVRGYSYEGSINRIGNISLNRFIQVLGYNHNIQSSLGVTTQVRTAIKNWISEKTQNIFNETCGQSIFY